MYITHLKLSDIILLPELELQKKEKKTKALKESDRALRESIIEVGMREPLLANERYELIDGYRRYYAIKDLERVGHLPPSVNISRIPCIVASAKFVHPAELKVQSYVRQDLTPSQEAYYYQKLLKEHGVKKSGLAKMIGIRPVSISNYLVILDCIDHVKQSIDSGKFPMSAGKIFCVMKPDGQKALYDKVKKIKKLSRRTLINQSKKIKDELFKRPKPERMRRSNALRQRKKGQIQDGGIKRDLILHDVNVEEKELGYVEKQLERTRIKLQGLITWWDKVLRHENIRNYIRNNYTEKYNDITFVLQDELGISY